ncbi:MAG: alkaline phosphatase family protein, partial [Acidobacteriaceae bacterium]|nr:alkaline phosphatase family protein [Acidobacteriaceae bacterium]
SSLAKEEESVLERGLRASDLLYLDFFTGDADHEGHATSAPTAMFHVLQELDAVLGQVWKAVQEGPLAPQTLLVVVSDHGMNNVPGILSQTFSLPDFFNSPAGGAHHVITDREQLSDYKLRGINPLVHRVVTPSTSSFYLKDQAARYPTAWLDIDGNERTAVHLRNSDLNKVHILLLQSARADLSPVVRKAAAQCMIATVDRHRTGWSRTAADLAIEISALDAAISERKQLLRSLAGRLTSEQREEGEDKAHKRLRREMNEWDSEATAYRTYLTRLRALLAFRPDDTRRFSRNIAELVPEMALGDHNNVADLEHYVVGPSPAGLVVGKDGRLDQARSFQYVNYFPLLLHQHALNNPQPQLSSNPIDFTAMALPDGSYYADATAPQHGYWLYGGEDRQLVILQDAAGRLSLKPACNLLQDENGRVKWTAQGWRSELPLSLFEDPNLDVPAPEDRGKWLSDWHSEGEWLAAIHKCRYSNGVIGITEELSPVAANVPGPPGINPVLLRFEKRRRELVQADFHVFAADHWNFNVRFPNPGGNHGGFLRMSTHSVWMMAGAGLPARQIDQPYDSLNFASTILNLLGRTPPMPDRVVDLQ